MPSRSRTDEGIDSESGPIRKSFRICTTTVGPQPLASGEFSTIRLRLLKIAVRIKETASRVRLAFASDCPDAALFHGLLGALSLRPT